MFALSPLHYWSSFVHIAKKLRLKTCIAATQSTIAKNDTGFPTANPSPSFRLMRKLAIQDCLSPLIHEAERCSRNGVTGSKKWKEIPKRNFIWPAQPQVSMLVDLWSSLPIPTEHKTSLLGKPPSLDSFREQTDILRSLSTLLNN